MNTVVRLWDSFIRGFHWILVLVLAGLWMTGGDLDYLDWHVRLGLLMLALLITRIMWGILGSQNARFSHFVRSPIAAFKHLRQEVKGQAKEPLGHNPAGGYMILVLLALLLIQALTGLFTDDDIFFRGPLAHWVDSDTARSLTRLHRNNFDWILIASGIHIVAIFWYLARKKDLLTPMITGNKEVETKEQQQVPTIRHGGWGFALLAFNLIWVFWWLG
ncbi:hydrogenase [Aliidiomarina minuta]|uniref:Hydrogenase n=1 Tax=Aliidiomarina minuta TaxID=880057 RepID=A0A432W939_9GAMM|nr:cytochrome b/b6 domain-containing protein [Aliidiomarina minuta]RUO26108.1 hydrogenase [Aliidiomarina minuta]